MGTNSLLIVPAGFNPSTGFASLQHLGLTHTLGTTLTVPAGQGFGGSGSINDPVNCQGTITATSGGAINLSGGLTLSGTGTVNLGSGNLTTNDLALRDQRRIAFCREPLCRQRRHGDLHAVRRDQQHQQYLSISATTPATAARTASAAAASCRHPTSTWATPARGPSRSPAGPTASATVSISATTPAAAAPTASAAAASLSASCRIRGLLRHGDLHAVRRDQQHQLATLYLGYNAGSSGTYSLSGSGQLSAYYASTWALRFTGDLHAVRRDQQRRRLPLSRQQRHLQPQQGPVGLRPTNT